MPWADMEVVVTRHRRYRECSKNAGDAEAYSKRAHCAPGAHIAGSPKFSNQNNTPTVPHIAAFYLALPLSLSCLSTYFSSRLRSSPPGNARPRSVVAWQTRCGSMRLWPSAHGGRCTNAHQFARRSCRDSAASWRSSRARKCYEKPTGLRLDRRQIAHRNGGLATV